MNECIYSVVGCWFAGLPRRCLFDEASRQRLMSGVSRWSPGNCCRLACILTRSGPMMRSFGESPPDSFYRCLRYVANGAFTHTLGWDGISDVTTVSAPPLQKLQNMVIRRRFSVDCSWPNRLEQPPRLPQEPYIILRSIWAYLTSFFFAHIQLL